MTPALALRLNPLNLPLAALHISVADAALAAGLRERRPTRRHSNRVPS